MTPKEILTLCHNCLGDYLEAGLIATTVPGQKFKDTCTRCQVNQGWDYEIEERKPD